MDDDWFDESESLYPDGMDGPTVKAPSVDVPSAEGDVFQDSPVARLFVLHVFVWNAVVLFVSLGAMLIYFRNDWETGGRLLAAGGVLAGYGLYRWPRGTDETDEANETAETESADLDESEVDSADSDEAETDESLGEDAVEPHVESEARTDS